MGEGGLNSIGFCGFHIEQILRWFPSSWQYAIVGENENAHSYIH